MGSITKLKSCGLSTYLVGPGFEGENNSKPKLSAIVMRSSVWIKWWWKFRSQSLSLMLKPPVMITVLLMFSMLLQRN